MKEGSKRALRLFAKYPEIISEEVKVEETKVEAKAEETKAEEAPKEEAKTEKPTDSDSEKK